MRSMPSGQAGHVSPRRANDSGLVYDIQPNDYILYLCGLGYTNQQVSSIVGRKVVCWKVGSIAKPQLSCPSFAVTLEEFTSQTYTRTVTNVGTANSTYVVEVDTPNEVNYDRSGVH